MSRQTNKLTDSQIKSAKQMEKPYKLADGSGMYLLVMPTGSKYWRMKYRFRGREKVAAFGVYPDVSLKDAREACRKARANLRDNIDPTTEKRAEANAEHHSFKSVAIDWHNQVSPKWDVQHAAKVIKSLERDAFPKLGKLSIDSITSQEILSNCKAISNRGAYDVAQRILQRIGKVFTYAIHMGFCVNNPANGLMEYLPKPERKPRHYPALTPAKMPEFLKALKTYDGYLLTKLAMRFLMLTFVRTGELRFARWDEFNLDTKFWTIPAERMKLPKEHVVPLSAQALGVLGELQTLTGHTDLLFPSTSNPRKVMSENTILFGIYRMGFKDQHTGHGFRTTASSYLNEAGFNPDAIERQLAHGEPNKVRDAYNRADYMTEREKMMQAWADYLDTCEDSSGKVVLLKHTVGAL